MAGKPIEAQLLADIEASGGWPVIWERVASGESQTAIAHGFGVSQGFFSRVIHLDAARVRAFREAKTQAATAYAEEAKQIVDDVPAERDEIAKARERSNVRRWLAASWDRPQYGEAQPDINVNVLNVNQLHLDALRHRTVDGAARVAPAPEYPILTPNEVEP